MSRSDPSPSPATDRPRRRSIEVAGAQIELLAWSESGEAAPLMLVHGNGAHADWWQASAPLLAQDRVVAALSLSGMGNSSWRDRYSLDLHAQEVIAALDAASLFDGPVAPWLVAHSFGSVVALHCLEQIARRIAGLIVVDNGLRADADRGPIFRPGREPTLYPDRETIIERFRLQPPQPRLDPAVMRPLAEASVIDTGQGWRWKFDPHARETRGERHGASARAQIAAASVPLTFVFGDESPLVTPDVVARTRAVAPAGTRFVGIPEAGHHVMIDQPIAFVAAVRALTA